MLTGISNPKAILFFSSVFPQFLDQTSSLALQGMLLGATFVLCWSFAFVFYAALGTSLKKSVYRASKLHLTELFSGVIYLIAAGMLAAVP